MKFSKPQHLLVLTAPVKFGRSSFLGVTVGVGFRLSDSRILAHETEIWSALESAPMSFKALDEAMPKAFAEWMMAGHAQTQGEKGAPAEWSVHVSVGDCHKEIVCKLPRTGFTEIAPDGSIRRKVALDFVNAYGGEGFQPNPVGTGFESDMPGAQPRLSFPDYYGQEHDFLAATGPLDSRWTQRSSYMSRDSRDLVLDSDHREHPGLPITMDRRFFQMSSRDQWSKNESWPADCSYSLSGVGDGTAGFSGRIPALEGQVIIRRSGKGAFEEVPMKRQTLWFFPDKNLGVVLFSGMISIEDMLSVEIEHLLGALSESGSPHGLSHLTDVAVRREDKTRNTLEGMRDDELMPAASCGWAWEYLLGPDDHPRVLQAPRSYESVRQRMQEYQSIIDSASSAVAEAKEQNIEEAKQQTQAFMRGVGGEATIDQQDWRKKLEALSRDKRRENLTIRDADLSHMDFSGQSWQDVQLVNVDLSGCLFQDANLRNVVFLGCRLESARFERTVLDSCHFKECQMAQSVWQAAQLSTVQFVESDFESVVVKGGHWKTTFFSETKGKRLDFEGVICENVQMQKCSFPSLLVVRGNFEGHVFIDCVLTGLEIRESIWKKSSCVGSQLNSSLFSHSQFDTCVFADACDISNARWSQCYFEKLFLGDAKFDQSICENCSLLDATLNALKANDTQWISCDISRGNLMHAELSRARMRGSSFKDANLYGADLRLAEVSLSNLMGANLGFVWREKNWEKYWSNNLMSRVIELPRRPEDVR